MHAASVEKSARLKRAREVLSDGRWHSTLSLIRRARIVAVSAVVSELRQAGDNITCIRKSVAGRPVWFYRRNAA